MNFIKKTVLKVRTSSMLCIEVDNYLVCLYLIVHSIRRNKKIDLSCGNHLAAVLLNIILGCSMFMLLNQSSTDLVQISLDCIESVVEYLRLVLKWLMGEPGGLKLNAAFNNVLGKFFLHQINLWWKFIGFWREGLKIIFFMSNLIACFGLTLKIAIVSDLISFVTFHVYCIYLFIARLFNLQLSGLTALLRLFVGRKHNPLRECVDSCQYSSQQLFVGTVAFTVLLFLLPTTALYYVVFTTFRLILLLIQGLFLRLCYFCRELPIYTFLLWAANSNKLSGTFYYEVRENDEFLVKKWQPRSLMDQIRNCKANKSISPVNWTNLLYCVFNGSIITLI